MEHGHGACCHTHQDHSEHNYAKLMHQTISAGIFGSILLCIYMFGIIPGLNSEYGFVSNAVVGIIVLGAMYYCGSQYYIGAWQSFLEHSATMDTLIAIGTISAWFYSAVVLIFSANFPSQAQHVYFESAIVIIALVNLGMLLEVRARKQSSSAIEKLLNLQPITARVVRNNQDLDIPIEELQIDDTIRIRPGDQIPVDGIIIEGNGTLDESMLTGESVPRNKTIGMAVTGGTINKSGSFVFKATKIGKDTVLAQIISLVKQAQNTKPQLARLADQISHIFVPSVLITAIVTAMIWYNIGIEPVGTYMFITTVSVLVIACPCALGLAVPISVMLGLAKAAQYGILIRDADALQQMAQITTIVLDKTGTITLGQPRVINVIPMPNQDVKNVLLIAASLEINSEHPYAQAIVLAAKSAQLQNMQVMNFESITGLGVKGDLNSEPISIGNASFMAAQLVAVDALQNEARQSAGSGQTLIYVSKNKQLIGGISISDPIRTEAKEAIQQLQDRNLKVIMITGDHYATAQAVASKVGITEVIAGVMPQEKIAKIISLQEEGEIVAMVGDGINDAPALSQANVGFAMGSGTDIAIQSADVAIINSKLHSIIAAIDLSQYSVGNMKQNLFAAFIFNIIGIPIAAGILYPIIGILLNPMLAALAMALSSFTVVTNANRLRLYKPRGVVNDR